MGNGASGDVGIGHVGINSWEDGDLNTSSLSFQRRERSQKPEICMEDEVEEYSSDGSEDEVVKKKFKKGGDRRKHQRMWTLSEATKLVDGISQFGVGRWTQIKRLSFSASAHRTPIDLRDKWRNLLRASYAQTPTKGGIEEENSGRSLPKYLLHQVRELASLHPYPRKDASRSLFLGQKGVDGRSVRRSNA
ncbi:hypothetical protein MLD38_032532 [Melastoma candidum]|uniref:Uncharacterized protein n=1 Tax=Melastoma candidum TaxID=119954 RepID=A0ACB9M661_9MYRT|nr:hypothetical protein MLD38_032532 [Melastoma candidum]